MKKLLILFVYLFSFFNLFSQVNPVGSGRIPNATTNFTTSVPYGFSLVDANTNKSYRVIRANGLDFNKKLSDYALGVDYLGSLTSLSVICNNGITKTLTDSTSTPVLTLGLGAITPTSVISQNITGGTATTSDLFLKTTSGVGTTGADMHFLVGNNGATEAVTILNNGNVGIGTTNPTAKLTLVGNSTGSIGEFYNTNASGYTGFEMQSAAGGTANWKTFFGYSNAGDHFRINANNIPIYLIQGGVEKFTLNTAGNVGIGTTSPLSLLHLKAGSATANTAPLQFTSGALETAPRAGVIEFLTDNWYGTITTGAVRKTFAFLENPTFTTNVTSPKFTSTVAVGTAPLSVTSTTKVPRLNVANSDSLGGLPASHYGTGNGTVTSIATTSPLKGGTITTAGTISIDTDTLTSWYLKQNKGKIAYDSLNYRYRRGDTATVLLSQNRASHQYLGKYANAVSATLVNTIPDVESDIDYYMPFLINADESNSLNTNSYFIYNPHLNLLSTNLLGNVTGNVSGSSNSCTGTAAYANKVEIDTITTDLDARIPFMASTGGNQKLYMDNTIKYNSGTETLTVPNLNGNATSSNKTDSVYISEDYSSSLSYIPFTNNYDGWSVLHSNDYIICNPSTGELVSNLLGNVTGNVTGNATTSGTADVALTLDDPSLYNLTDFNSYGAAAYSSPIANGSGGITWGATAGGINAKNYATAVAVGNVTQSGTGQTIDGQVCNEGATVLCIGQTIKASNGAWLIPESGAWTRRADMDTWAELYQAYIPIVSGTTYGGSSWYCTIPSSGTLGYNDITFTEFLFPSSIEAGDGLTKTGTTLSTNVDNSTIEIHTDTLRIKDLGVTTSKLANSSVTNAKIPAAAGIDVTKLQGVSGTTGAGLMMLNAHPAFGSSTGTSPFTVTSTTKVTNLNVDQLDGADLETTITNSDTKIPSSKAVETYVSSTYAPLGTQNIHVETFTGSYPEYEIPINSSTIIAILTSITSTYGTAYLPVMSEGRTITITNYSATDKILRLRHNPTGQTIVWYGDYVDIHYGYSYTFQISGGNVYVINKSNIAP